MVPGSPAGPAPLDDVRSSRVPARPAAALFELDAGGELTYASPAWHGRLPDVHPDDKARVSDAWNGAVRAAEPLDIRYRAIVNDEITFLRTRFEPVYDASGTAARFAGVTIDESPSNERLPQAMPQLVWVAQADGTIVYLNRAWSDYTGVTLEAVRDGAAQDVVHPGDSGIACERWGAALARHEPYETECRLRCASDGTYRWFLARATPVRDEDGGITHWVGTATDIDAQKRAYANLRFVLETGASLASTYDVETICDDLAQLAVSRVSDWCFIVLTGSAKRDRRTVVMAHRDPARVAVLEHFRGRYPTLRVAALETAIRRNVPFLMPHVTHADLQAVRDPEQLELLEALQMRSAMIVPLTDAAGQTYGAMLLGSSESAHSFTHEDLEVAEMVAQRAASAIRTARAFGEERRRSKELHFIARAGEIAFESFDLQSTFDRVTEFIVEDLADLAYVMLLEGRESLRTVSVAHRNPEKRLIAQRMRGQRTLRPQSEDVAVRMLTHHRASVHPDVPVDAVLANMWEYLAADVRALDLRSGATIPLHSRGETFGALVLYRCGEDASPYEERDLPLLEDLGRRLSIAIDHAGTLTRERRIAEALQQALLPKTATLPNAAGMRFVAEYRPSSHEADVGGDWYDAIALEDGSIAVSVGDVTGRGLDAAGLMGKLRQGMAMVAIYETDPARMLDAVDYHLRASGSPAIATAFVGIIDPQRTQMRYASAGHPPPLLRRSGELCELRSDGLPIGLRDAAREESKAVSLDDAQLLVLYTDGLTEATRDVEFGERRLQQLASSEAILYVHNAARFLCDACLPQVAQDDTAVLTVSFGERAHWAFDAENAQAAHEARSQFRAHLQSKAAPDADLDAAELIFGELIGNVVRHAPGPIDVQVQWANDRPVLHVTDRGKGFIRNPALPMDPLSESGRGLYIVSLLARGVTVERIPGYGNHVAAELNLSRAE